MMSSSRFYVVLLAIGLSVVVGVALATVPRDAVTGRMNESGETSPSTISGLLEVPGVERLDGGEQERDQLVADHANPVAAQARSLSRTGYEHLAPAAAIGVIGQTVPFVAERSPSGIGHLPAGAHVSRYLGVGSARLDLPGGEHALAESMMPVATRSSSGGYVPVDLALREYGRGFAADAPATPVSIPRSLESGVKLDASDVSLTPVTASGTPLAGTGRLDGGAVIYPNTATDADTAAKPTSSGFEVYDTLRSVASPQTLSYRVGMPAGASLRPVGSGAASVVVYGRTLASISSPSAIDSEGARVPVSVSISGDTVKLTVDHRSGDYRYPIVVDPTVEDPNLFGYQSNWRFINGGGEKKGGVSLYDDWQMEASPSVKQNEWGALVYPTQGESRIYDLFMETASSLGGSLQSHLAIAGPPPGGSEYEKAVWEGSTPLANSHGREGAWVWACVPECATSRGSAGNVALYWVNAIKNAEGLEGTGVATAYAGTVYIAQNNGPTIAVDTTHENDGFVKDRNIFFDSKAWMGKNNSNVAMFDVADPGIGVSGVEYTVAGKKWTQGSGEGCAVQCPMSEEARIWQVSGAIPDGEPTIEAKALNAMRMSSTTATAKLRVDSTAPYEITLSGLPASDEINDATRTLKLVAHATDGVTGTPSSGVASIALALDGSEVGAANGSCSPGPCTATGEWSVNVEDLAAGKHTFTVTATDAASNHASGETTFTVHHAATVPLSPGQLNPVTGNFDLEETDVSIATTGSPLTVTRGYSSREPSAGFEGAFGAPWTMGFGGTQELIQDKSGGMTLVATDGSRTLFNYQGGGKFESPHGDSSLVLTSSYSTETEYTLTDKGTSTVFTHVTGDNPAAWRPAIATGTNGRNTVQYTYQIVGGALEPLEDLGPVPAGVSCTPSLKPGCRALTFNFATSTTAKGENSSEWGDYTGRLTRVYFATAEEKEGKTVEVTKTVAQYSYDDKGRLRAVWDPRISPALKGTYGYDAEGHVVAISPPAQEPWTLIYGSTAQDTTPGRLVQVVRPPAETALWNGNVLANTLAPALSGSPVVNGEVGAGKGRWSNAPVTYGYQWERCNGSGAECKVISGATNSNYTVVAADAGHTLLAHVTGINGGGAVVATSAPTAIVTTTVSGGSSVTQSLSSSALTAVSCVTGYSTCVVGDAKGNVYYATNVSGGSPATWKSWTAPGASPSDALSCASTSLCLLASGEKGGPGGTLYYGAPGGAWTQAYNPANGVDALSCASTSFCLAGQDKYGDFAYSTNPGSTSWSPEELGPSGRAIKGVSCLSPSFCGAVDGTGDLLVATSAAQVESSAWTESDVDGSSPLNGVACTTTQWCIAVDGSGNVLDLALGEGGVATASKQDVDGSNKLTAVACSHRCVAVDDHGNAFVSVNEGRTWVEEYQFGDDLTSLSCYVTCVAVDTTGHVVAFEPTVVIEGKGAAPVNSTMIEYGVPSSGSGAPYALGGTETSKWAQTDVPVEGTAIFPEWKREGWPAPGATLPAPSYKGATITYLDNADRVVDLAGATGGIAVSEFNSYGDVVRTLSADDREAALKEGSKSAEASQTLDTQSAYGSEGTELLSTLGPLHTVKLASGATVKARRHTVYSYDEGAPSEGGPYKLVTKVTEGAQVSGEPEADVRTTTDSYWGQNGLGWILRKPTATRVDPSGLDLVHSAAYDPSTGKVTEIRTPGAPAPNEESQSYVYKSSFGSSGSGNGQMNDPAGIARDSEGNLYVADEGNNRIDEFSSSGTFIKKFGGTGVSEGELKEPKGITIDSHGTIWVANRGKNRISAFNKEGKYVRPIGLALKGPDAVAYSPYNGRLYIADTEDDRVEWINPEHEYEYGLFGSLGKGNGQFNWPEGIAIDSSGNVWVSDTNGRVQKLTAAGVYVSEIDVKHESSEEKYPTAIAFDAEGNVIVDEEGSIGRVEVFSASGVYKSRFGGAGSEEERTTNSSGLVLDSSGDAYVVNEHGGRVEKWAPVGHESRGTGGTHGMQTIYYTAASNPEVTACGNQPAWAGMPCEKRPAAQPETGGVPNLPVTTVTYNLWDEPLESTETVGATTRTDAYVYDEAGRTLKETVSSSVGTALPSVEYTYSTETGAVIKSSSTTEGVTRQLESTYDRRGELTSYEDADRHTSKFTYTFYGRLEKAADEVGEQIFGYSASGLMSEIKDSAAGAFEASYDVEGNLAAEKYPNGMTANRTFDPTGREVGIEYVKTTHCTSGCVWYSQSESPSIHGQTLSQASTLSSQTYAYDAASRLTTVQDTPSGEGCTTRIYGYNEETDITSLTTRAPGSGGKCASEGGSAVNHSYDSANRLTDAGIEYNTFGDIAKLPAGDAGGSALTSAYYVDGTLASQSQNGETIGYKLDPSGRDREIVSTGTTNSTATYAYDDQGHAPAWTEDTSGKVTRNVYGFGGLTAVRSGTESPVLQIEDLHRNIVGTASLSETATGLLSKGDSTEYGVPRTSSPAKYSWQGAFALRTELPSGVIAMGARSYVPGIARFLQPDPVEGGSANEYSYTYGDPIDSADPSGEYTVATPGWLAGFLDEEAEAATEAAIQRAAEEQAAREEAEEKAQEAAEEAFDASLGSGSGEIDKKGKVNSSILMMHYFSDDTDPPQCLDFARIGGPIINPHYCGSNHKYYHIVHTQMEEEYIHEHHVLAELVESGETVYKTISEAAKANGISTKELSDAIGAFAEAFGL